MTTLENQYDNLVSAIEALKKRGYVSSFKLKNNDLLSLESGNSYAAGEVEIKEFHRFEGATDFEDMSILYGIETSTGEKGTLIDAFGTYANRKLGEFLKDAHFS